MVVGRWSLVAGRWSLVVGRGSGGSRVSVGMCVQCACVYVLTANLAEVLADRGRKGRALAVGSPRLGLEEEATARAKAGVDA